MWIVLLLPIPVVTSCAGYNGVLYFYLRPNLTTCGGYVDCYISTYASCDDLSRACGVLNFYLRQLRRMRLVLFFLPIPAVPGAPSFVFLPISTVPGFDHLCWVIFSVIFFHKKRSATTIKAITKNVNQTYCGGKCESRKPIVGWVPWYPLM